MVFASLIATFNLSPRAVSKSVDFWFRGDSILLLYIYIYVFFFKPGYYPNSWGIPMKTAPFFSGFPNRFVKLRI
jgi:hypothetical protein